MTDERVKGVVQMAARTVSGAMSIAHAEGLPFCFRVAAAPRHDVVVYEVCLGEDRLMIGSWTTQTAADLAKQIQGCILELRARGSA